MKRIIFLCIVILNIFTCTACGSSNIMQNESNTSNVETSASNQAIPDKDEIQELFQKWDTSMIEDSEKETTIKKFGNYLKSKNNQNIDELRELSENFTINSLADISVITYIETPEFYGESGKLSYTWVMYNDSVEMVFNGDSKEIQDIFQDENNKKIFYLIGRDYLITSCTGVFVSRIMLEDDNIEFDKDVIEIKSNDTYRKQEGVLYGKSQLDIQKGNTDGTQMNVKELNGDSSLKLYLTEDNTFKEGK